MTNSFAKRSKASTKWVKRPLQMLVAAGMLFGAGLMQSCDKDILTGQPSWLGNSIYERLQEGIEVDGQMKTFNTTLRLIDDLGYKETLSRTGSKTVFVASDADYEKWFQSNSWGVTNYDELTLTQKKLIFNGAMINNSYLVDLMSNVPSTSENKDPEEGMCMRRETAASIYDNIPAMAKEDFPHNDAIEEDPVNKSWSVVSSLDKDIYILKDATAVPMIHFLPEFMKKNNIVDTDLELISNGQSNSINDAWINGKKVISSEQTCKNGYVYVVDGVMEANKSMAEIINEQPETKLFSKLLRRFSVPVRLSLAQQREFWRLFPDIEEGGDSLYNLRYLNQSGNHRLATPTGNSEDDLQDIELLKFDPGWNQYKADNNQLIMQNDAAAMLVPTDEALEDWFNNGTGKSLKEQFGTWEAIPHKTLVKLLNVNMLESFVSSVPSKFNSILDDSQRSMGVEAGDIVKCYMGCNGVVYVTNKVFAPAEFSSVMYPANILSSNVFSVIYSALTGNYTTTQDVSMDYSPYLTSMDSRFSLILPYNMQSSFNPANTNTVFRMVDPASYGLPQQYVLEFYYANGQVSGYAYPCTIDVDGTMTIDETKRYTLDSKVIANRLFDHINNSTIIFDTEKGETGFTSAQKYYKTKAGSILYVDGNGTSTTFKGGYQLNNNESVKVDNVYEMGNGTTYGVSGDENADAAHMQMPLTSQNSVYQVLKKMKEEGGDTLFFNLVYNDITTNGFKTTKDGSSYCASSTTNYNLSLFDNYNYTVYLPSDKAVKELIDGGYLPTWEMYENESDTKKKEAIAERIHNFIRYHVQDNSVYVGGETLNGQQYESGMLNPNNNRFYSIKVTSNGNSMTVTDQLGKTYNVSSKAGEYNIPCREFWLSKQVDNTSSKAPYTALVNASSHVVIQKIDGALLYENLTRLAKTRR